MQPLTQDIVQVAASSTHPPTPLPLSQATYPLKASNTPSPPEDTPTERPPSPAPSPTRPTGEVLQETGLKLSTQYGLGSGIQFQRVGARGIGNEDVIRRGVIDAIDIWGFAEQGYEVCFPAHGELVFLSAANSPRRPMPVLAQWKNGMTCAAPGGAGTLALVQVGGGGGGIAHHAPATAAPAKGLGGCQVITNYILNLRNAPGGDTVLLHVPWQTVLTAWTRTNGWFQVSYGGQTGWISAPHVQTRGNCA